MRELQEQKSILAKLMASENISVRHAKVPTAGFDPKSRTLVLPILKEMEGEVYDLFVCHEVGHALYTPAEGWHKAVCENGPNYKGFLNIVEDARIEKLIKRKYHGAAKSMHAGYQVLMHERDFFGIKKFNIDINSAPLIDKLNIHFKGGLREAVRFTDEEMPFVRRMEKLETWSEVEKLTADIWGWCSDREDQLQDLDEMHMQAQMEDEEDIDCEDGDMEQDEMEMDSFGTPEVESPESEQTKEDCEAPVDSCPEAEGGGEEEGVAEEEEKGNSPADKFKDEFEKQAEKTPKMSQTDTGGHDSWYDEDPWTWESKPEPQAITDREFRSHEEELIHEDAIEIRYVNSPKMYIKNNGLIINYKELLKEDNRRIADRKSDTRGYDEKQLELPWEYAREWLKVIDKDNKPVVNYLAKEFEMKKKAAEYKRSQTANSGIISLTDIHKYRYSDNIFKKVTIVPEGKNHGLYMLMDWSGSMHEKMIPTFVQLLQLVDFCRKCAIKHEVYAFVDFAFDEDGNGTEDELHARRLEDHIPGNISPSGDYRTVQLIELFSHKMSAKDFRDMREHLTVALLRCDREYHEAPYMEQRRYNKEERAKWSGKKYRPLKETTQETIWNVMKEKHGLTTWCWSGMTSTYNFTMSRLCGTPLNSAIMFSIPNCNRFRKDNRLDIVNTIILSDGESNSSYNYWIESKYESGPVITTRSIETVDKDGNPIRTKLVDTETKKTFDWNRKSNCQETVNCLEYYKFKTGSNVVGFFLCTSSDTAGRLATYSPKKGRKVGAILPEYDLHRNQYNREGYIVVRNLGYSELYVIKANKSVQTDDEINLDTEKKLTTAQITRAFKKFQSGKLEKRVLLNRFAEMVA